MGDVVALKAVFPDIENDVLEAMLAHHGNMERVVEALLDESTGEVPGSDPTAAEIADEDLARQVQEGLDSEVAAALQQELNAERQAVQTPRPTTSPQLAERMAAATAGTKRFFQPLLQRASRQLSAKTTRSGQAERLLDDAAVASSDANQPLASPMYSPPYAAQPYLAPAAPLMPPTPAPPMPPPTSSTRAGADEPPAAAGSSPGLIATPPPSRYTSRVERARLANRTSSAARASSASPPTSFDSPLPSTLAPLCAPPAAAAPPMHATLVPVGELI